MSKDSGPGDIYDVPPPIRMQALACCARNARGATTEERRADLRSIAEHLGLTDLLTERMPA